jgi:hypothetical protein
MTKNSSPPRIPPLPFHVLTEVQDVERHLRISLEAADLGGGRVNIQQAIRVLDTCVAEALGIQLDYYASLPNYCSEWAAGLAVRTIESAIASFPVLTSGEPFRPRLQETVSQFLQDRREAKTQAAPQVTIPTSEPLNEQIEALRIECRMTVEELAEGMSLDVRSVRRHLAGDTAPYDRHLWAYQRLFSKVLNINVVINKMP